jgi:hypothetical protein
LFSYFVRFLVLANKWAMEKWAMRSLASQRDFSCTQAQSSPPVLIQALKLNPKQCPMALVAKVPWRCCPRSLFPQISLPRSGTPFPFAVICMGVLFCCLPCNPHQTSRPPTTTLSKTPFSSARPPLAFGAGGAIAVPESQPIVNARSFESWVEAGPLERVQMRGAHTPWCWPAPRPRLRAPGNTSFPLPTFHVS